MARTGQKPKIRRYLLRQIARGHTNPIHNAMDWFGVSRQYVSRLLRELIDEDLLDAHGTTSNRMFTLKLQTHRRRFPVTVPEDRVWRDFAAPILKDTVQPKARAILQYGISEMVNNVIDHSGADSCVLEISLNPALVAVHMSDAGVGIFGKLRDHFELDDAEHAALELSKGKLTTDPDHHTGEGIFFTSRMMDEFIVASDQVHLITEHGSRGWVPTVKQTHPGTTIQMLLDPETSRSTRAVFDMFTLGADDPSFSVTHVPVSLVEVGEDNLISRSQAKRLMARLEDFQRVLLDFKGVRTVGQAFSDEVFRVWANAHPDVEIVVRGANKQVQRMVERAREKRASAQVVGGPSVTAGAS
jgi:anti-sigma regulatory factor (Ser/Thr protein kinase)